MSLMIPTLLCLFMIAASIYNQGTTKEFCNSSKSVHGSSKQYVDACIPCPGRCRDGKLVSCPSGFTLSKDHCERDILFWNQVDMLKRGIVEDVRASKAAHVSEVRATFGRTNGDEHVLNAALEELTGEGVLLVSDGGVLTMPNLISAKLRAKMPSLLSVVLIGSILLGIALVWKATTRHRLFLNKDVRAHHQTPLYIPSQVPQMHIPLSLIHI